MKQSLGFCKKWADFKMKVLMAVCGEKIIYRQMLYEAYDKDNRRKYKYLD